MAKSLMNKLYWMTASQIAEMECVVECALHETELEQVKSHLENLKVLLSEKNFGLEYYEKAEPRITHDDAFNALARTLDRS